MSKINIATEDGEIKIFCVSSNGHGLMLSNHSHKYPFWHLITKDASYRKWTIKRCCLCSPGSKIILNLCSLSATKCTRLCYMGCECLSGEDTVPRSTWSMKFLHIQNSFHEAPTLTNTSILKYIIMFTIS